MTHCERVLALLADGREHSHHELYALNVVAHSRVAELRKRGHTILQRRVEGADGAPDYLYQLVPLGEQPEPVEAFTAAGLPQGEVEAATPRSSSDCSPSEGEQALPSQESPSSLASSGEHSIVWGRSCGSPEQLSLLESAA